VHQPLFHGDVIELTGANFSRHIGVTTYLSCGFWAPWVRPCRMMAPQFSEAAAELESGARLVKVNADAEPGLATNSNPQQFPRWRCSSQVARSPVSLASWQVRLGRWVRAHA